MTSHLQRQPARLPPQVAPYPLRDRPHHHPDVGDPAARRFTQPSRAFVPDDRHIC